MRRLKKINDSLRQITTLQPASLGVPRLTDNFFASLQIKSPSQRFLEESARSLSAAPFSVAQPHRRMIDQIAAASRPSIDLFNVHRTWLGNAELVQNSSLRLLQNETAQFRFLQKSAFESITKRLDVSEQLLAAVDFSSIRKSLSMPQPDPYLGIRNSINEITDTYAKLAKSIRTYADVARLPQFVLPSVAREVLATSYAANVILPHKRNVDPHLSEFKLCAETEIEEEHWACVVLLENINTDLVTIYEGAYLALQGENPDRQRQFLSSLRELYNHLMRELAPDTQVLQWINGDQALLHNGKPTRKARISYVVREISDGPLADFSTADTQAFVELWTVFNRVHELKPKFSEQQLQALWLKANSWLTYILKLLRYD